MESGKICSDQEYRHWCEGLRPASDRREETVAELRALLLRVARRELDRRRHQLGSISGPEVEDLAEQSANDAALKVMSKLDEFRRASRFTTWAIKFAIFEASAQVARHHWGNPAADADAAWDTIPDAYTPGPDKKAEEREVFAVLTRAIQELTERQRRVFVAVALNEASLDALALELDTNRNALYKNLFDARRKLRSALAGAGHDLGGDR